MKRKITSFLLFSFFLIGCGGSHSSSNSTTIFSNTTVKNISNCVSVYTLGNVVNAVVADKMGHIAKYDKNNSKYCFSDKINYPISVKVLPSTFIDVDYDNVKTANDIKPQFNELKSYYNYIDLITDMHAKAVDSNLSNDSNNTITLSQAIDYYKNLINKTFNINLENPINDDNEKILNFVTYDYYLNKGVLPDIDTYELYTKYNNLKIFFDNDLNKPTIEDKVKYYSFYHSLELLDKKLIKRVDTIYKPQITYLHKNNLPIIDTKVIKSYYYNVLAKDIKTNINGIYVASGLDGVAKYTNSNYSSNYGNSEFTLSKKIKFSDTFSDSYNLDIFSYYDNNNIKREYLFVADGGEAISLIDISGGNFNNMNAIMWKYYDQVKDKNISITIDDSKGLKQIDEVISVKTYVSPLESKMWLAFGTRNNGLYLVDLNKILPSIQNSLYPIIVYNSINDVNNTLWIPGDSGTVYSEAFSSNGENIYATKGKTIEKYDLSSILSLSSLTPTLYNIKADDAYNLKMITKNGINELFVSTNRGVEVYDVLNNGDLNFISEYTTEGAQSGYLPKMEYISERNILLFTDGYKGLKAIKYDVSYKPKLCGVGYFSFYSDKTKSAKVTSVATYYDTNDNIYYVIVGVEGYGLLKFKLDDLLFKHCQ
jgi:hypothetical protein